jgi:crotonobetainyl-CoA:carnitine CoA-transferase CaiB-like acyl-CoA transferase
LPGKEETMLNRALEGVSVLDLSRILAGPWCTQNLADLGADVIKVESPKGGDDTRKWGPPFLDIPGSDDRFSAYFLSCNRGKQSIAIDISQADGAALVRQLAAKADVLVENFKSGSLAKFGLDYESLRGDNPRLVYMSITGFGQEGPMAGRPGYDYVFQGYGGLMSYTGRPDDEPGGGPLRVGASIIDLSTGMYGTTAVLAALFQREISGKGQYIDLSLSDVAVALNANQNMNYLVSGQVPVRRGNAHPNLAPYEIFACQDGQHLILAIGNDQQFVRFCELAGEPSLATDTRFATNEQRLSNLTELRGAVSRLLLERSMDVWRDLLDKDGVPWGPVNTLDQVFHDPQTKFKRIRQDLTHPLAGKIPTVRNPLSHSDMSETKAPPLLGEDTDDVLAGLGMSPENVARLKTQGVVVGR